MRASRLTRRAFLELAHAGNNRAAIGTRKHPPLQGIARADQSDCPCLVCLLWFEDAGALPPDLVLHGASAGTRVAVKVRHPGVGHAIARDFALMMFVARGVSWLPGMQRLRLEDSLKQFAAPLTEQVRPALPVANPAYACRADSRCDQVLWQQA